MSDQAASGGRGARPPRGRWASLHARLSSERLAQAVAQGREDAFAEIYRRHHQELYRYCHSILRNGEEAEDALQSVMTKAFVALRARERDLAVRPWLFRIAHNEAITLLRRRRRQDLHVSQMAIEAVETLDLSPERTIEQRERMSTLLSDLAALAERPRAALLMRELSGLSIEEIAGALATTPGAAKQALFEARHALREFAEGRTMDCERVRRLIEEHDGRVLRSRLVRSHLRSCASCFEIEQAIAQRRADLRALVPPLSALSGGVILARLLGHAGIPHGGAGIVAAAGGNSGAAGAAGLGGGASGGAAAGVAGGATGGGLSAAIGGSAAAKAVLGAAIVAFAAAGAVHVASSGSESPLHRAVGHTERHAQEIASDSARSVPGPERANEPHAREASSPNRTRASIVASGGHGLSGSASSLGQGAETRGRPNARQGIVHQTGATANHGHGGARAHVGGAGGHSKAHGRGPEGPLGRPHRSTVASGGKAERQPKGSQAKGQPSKGNEAKRQRSKANAKGHSPPPRGSAGASQSAGPGKSASQGGRPASEGKASQHGHNGSGQSVTSSESSTSTTVSRSQGHAGH